MTAEKQIRLAQEESPDVTCDDPFFLLSLSNAVELDALRGQIEKVLALAAGFMSESNHAMFTDAANALLTRSTDRREL